MKTRFAAMGLVCAGVVCAASVLAAEGEAKGAQGDKGARKGAEMGDRFAAADTDANGSLSLDEFKVLSEKRMEARKQRMGDKFDATKVPSAEDQFKKLDTDANGALSKEELAAGRERPGGGAEGKRGAGQEGAKKEGARKEGAKKEGEAQL